MLTEICSNVLNLIINLKITLMSKLWIIPFAVVFGFIGRLFLDCVIKAFNKQKGKRGFIGFSFTDFPIIKILAIMNGIIEITLYSFCFVLSIPAFIAFYIGIKTAVGWKYEKRPPSPLSPGISIDELNYNEARFFYYRFLLGNALNIIFGYIIAIIIENRWITFTSLGI
jgi:hypothetical protein